ncbi:winged helix DNA-binding domain-containing protein [Halomarina oriensis]|uniref:Winged helix DNA-binding domain-containing protein n=2 Tax=Halomarina oriensis TaxID=671145 RepID=A0A6B0GJ11_9EURY|nr:winged helix DNA-binding domain-containing protein [Halomarina oriensis]
MPHSIERAVRTRLREQRIAPRASEDTPVADVVRDVVGIQAQEKPAAALSLRARRRGLTTVDIEHALYEERSIVRTWCMRGTLHYVATEDLPWLLALCGPTFATRGPEPRRLAAWGLDNDTAETAVETIGEVLADEGPLTKQGIAEALVARGTDVDPSTQAPWFLIRRAALCGVCCEVAPIDGKNAYDRLDSWVDLDDPPADDERLATLARRYLTAYGPATRADFAAWCGLYATDVKTAWASLADETTEVPAPGGMASVLDTVADVALDDPLVPFPTVRLLGGYDSYLLGYAKENRVIPNDTESHLWPGGGIIRPAVVRDGWTMGIWRLDRSRATTAVEVTPLGPLDDARAELAAEASDVGRFLGEPVELRLEPRLEW